MSWRSAIQAKQQQRHQQGQWRSRQTLQSPQGPRVTIDGRTYDNFCSNDYLGLANDSRLAAAAAAAIDKFGVGSGASHLICGHQAPHALLERRLAEFMNAEQAIVFSTGYMANLAIAQAFLGRQDVVFQDKLNHASLIDAGRSSEAKLKRYPHLDVAALRQNIATVTTGQKMVMTDGVFSMDGDLAPVIDLKNVADDHDALLVVDEAHGFGVLGGGRGAAAAAGVLPTQNVLVMGTLGKAAGSFGAFVAADQLLIEQLIQYGRTYIYTTALPPHVIAATIAAIDVLQNTSGELSTKLQQKINRFKTGLSKQSPCQSTSTGQRFLASSTPIQPLLIGDSQTAMRASDFLRQQGFLVTAIRPPTVPVDSARLRFTITAAHDDEAIERLTHTLTGNAFQKILNAAPGRCESPTGVEENDEGLS